MAFTDPSHLLLLLLILLPPLLLLLLLPITTIPPHLLLNSLLPPLPLYLHFINPLLKPSHPLRWTQIHLLIHFNLISIKNVCLLFLSSHLNHLSLILLKTGFSNPSHDLKLDDQDRFKLLDFGSHYQSNPSSSNQTTTYLDRIPELIHPPTHHEETGHSQSTLSLSLLSCLTFSYWILIFSNSWDRCRREALSKQYQQSYRCLGRSCTCPSTSSISTISCYF